MNICFLIILLALKNIIKFFFSTAKMQNISTLCFIKTNFLQTGLQMSFKDIYYFLCGHIEPSVYEIWE